MRFMTCSTCSRVVQINCTGICLSCQRGFQHGPSEDAYSNKWADTQALTKRLEEIEDALQKSETKSIHVCEQTVHGQAVRSRNPKRKTTAKKSKKKKR